MSTRNVEEQLRDYLDWVEEQRRQGFTPEMMSQKLDALALSVRRVAADRLEDRQTLARHGRRIGQLEHQVALMSTSSPAVPDWHADPAEITGTHQFAVVQRAQRDIEERLNAEEARRRDSGIWWRRQTVLWTAAVVIGLILASVGGCIGYAVKQIDPTTKRAQ